MVKLKEVLHGKKSKLKKLDILTDQQKQLMSLISEGLTSGQGAYGDLFAGFNQQEFDKGVTEPALKNYKERILPVIQEKFISGNQVGGSGAQNEALKSGVDLQSQLAQLMYQAQQDQRKQSQQNKLAASQLALGTKTFENYQTPEKTGAVEALLQGAIPSLGTSAGEGIKQNIGPALSGLQGLIAG